MSDSDRQALRLAQDLREEMRAALPQLPADPSVSPYVDPGGTPSVLLRMDADTARALMAVLAERRAAPAGEQPAEPRRADGSHVPPPVPPQSAPPAGPATGPVAAVGAPFGESPFGIGAPAPYGQPAFAEASYAQAPYGEAPYAEAPYAEGPYAQVPYGQAPVVGQDTGGHMTVGGTGPTPLVPSAYPTH
ncbi:hypothetical protein [Actinomadura algeriensis]|uniref:Uncharacterized protein n=1 Tax=Actinomadura algeriensis TaxID=1679523 RepID=A0ABR9JZ61_9ACTN|nr:hypothetical protein [Actinomadura algeriensis]MBE1535679.1 hypothetical protein [Actinomadura algeriensis]